MVLYIWRAKRYIIKDEVVVVLAKGPHGRTPTTAPQPGDLYKTFTKQHTGSDS